MFMKTLPHHKLLYTWWPMPLFFFVYVGIDPVYFLYITFA
jgi:hypothetical protein